MCNRAITRESVPGLSAIPVMAGGRNGKFYAAGTPDPTSPIRKTGCLPMDTHDPKNIAIAFVEKINAHDVSGLCTLMTADHLFIDSVDAKVRGRENMRKAWLAYFHIVPDFTIEVSQMMVTGSTVGLFGRARGTFSPDGTLARENQWEMPSAWRAVVRDGLVAEWQVYADNEPVRVLMSKA